MATLNQLKKQWFDKESKLSEARLIQQRRKKKKADLEAAMNAPAPEEVSFADDTDTPIDGAVLDNLLEDTLKQRQQDMDAASRLHDPPPGAAKPGKRVAWADQQDAP